MKPDGAFAPGNQRPWRALPFTIKIEGFSNIGSPQRRPATLTPLPDHTVG
jgi:hypothetical protein